MHSNTGTHFNGLTPAEAERLAMLAEECGEVIQIVGKILRHGFESQHPDGGLTNRQLLEKELGDLVCIGRWMSMNLDIEPEHVDKCCDEKQARISRYTHHQDAAMLPPVNQTIPMPPCKPAKRQAAGETPEATLAHKAVTLLNEMRQADPQAVYDLVEVRVPCNAKLAGHPSVTVLASGGAVAVGLLGVLNGLCCPGTLERICAVYDEAGILIDFRVISWEKSATPDTSSTTLSSK